MPVKKDPSGRRSVEAEVEVPGSPEDVWRAIASGTGISSWFVPTELEEREGGTTVSHFGPGNSMDSVAKITLWEPPRRFVAETQEAPGTVATEWSVEARAGGVCVVRVVHSWFASTDDWDNQFEGHTHGWTVFFRLLRLYLAHFPGQSGATLQLMAATSPPTADAWKRFAGPLALKDAVAGQQVTSPPGAPVFSGVVERAGPPEYPEIVLRLDRPAIGLAHMFALPMGGQVYIPVRLYLYGDRAGAAVAAEEPVWQAWLKDRFAPSGST